MKNWQNLRDLVLKNLLDNNFIDQNQFNDFKTKINLKKLKVFLRMHNIILKMLEKTLLKNFHMIRFINKALI